MIKEQLNDMRYELTSILNEQTFSNPTTKDIMVDKYLIERIIALMDKAKSEIGSAELEHVEVLGND